MKEARLEEGIIVVGELTGEEAAFLFNLYDGALELRLRVRGDKSEVEIHPGESVDIQSVALDINEYFNIRIKNHKSSPGLAGCFAPIRWPSVPASART